ncbi:hypothetical protein K2X14_17265 [Acetobacter sp. TBRC 12305]|uniref:Uncharacterized protein n=1 Tax=Acetobacter garciniae TaxID=2817435 RepID=A0A939KS37_9PROT|nr:hypothetical protein [Acetobacter garciniae]MBO1326846.1 hypothetical protein [Acetobacter garciniae]MBX0346570.1 hypothetical protein [Acetobacter garciniae]
MSGLNISQFKHLVVRPVVTQIGLGTDAAVNLLTGTALAESGLVWLAQICGPALGLFQMEPATHDDCWKTFLPGQPVLADALRRVAGRSTPDAGLMASNLAYACAMARVKYYRALPPLPAANDAAGLSAYHKQHYNTPLGAADAGRNVALFQQAINA